jgi:hypothetical protein
LSRSMSTCRAARRPPRPSSTAFSCCKRKFAALPRLNDSSSAEEATRSITPVSVKLRSDWPFAQSLLPFRSQTLLNCNIPGTFSNPIPQPSCGTIPCAAGHRRVEAKIVSGRVLDCLDPNDGCDAGGDFYVTPGNHGTADERRPSGRHFVLRGLWSGATILRQGNPLQVDGRWKNASRPEFRVVGRTALRNLHTVHTALPATAVLASVRSGQIINGLVCLFFYFRS